MIRQTLYIANTQNKGRGVFTKTAIEADTIIEISPVIIMSDNDRKLIDQTLLHDYIFEWQPNCENMCCMALGWIPIYNHSNQSNCEYYMDYDNQSIFIKTVRVILPGEELTINYNGDWDEKANLWFEVKD